MPTFQRRWTLWEHEGTGRLGSARYPITIIPGSPRDGDPDGIEVMPVSELNALREAAQAVVDECDQRGAATGPVIKRLRVALVTPTNQEEAHHEDR